MQSLTDTLGEKIGKDNIKLSACVECIERSTIETRSEWTISWKSNLPRLFGGTTNAKFDSVVYAAPLNSLGRDIQIVEEGVGNNLNWIPAIRYAPVSALIFGFTQPLKTRGGKSFGQLIFPLEENESVCASIINSSKGQTPFGGKSTQEERALLTLFLREENVESVNQSDMVQVALAELREILDIKEEPVFCQSIQWNDSMPIHTGADAVKLKKTKQLLEEIPGLFLLGCHASSATICEAITQANVVASRVDFSLKQALPNQASGVLQANNLMQSKRKLRQDWRNRQKRWKELHEDSLQEDSFQKVKRELSKEKTISALTSAEIWAEIRAEKKRRGKN